MNRKTGFAAALSLALLLSLAAGYGSGGRDAAREDGGSSQAQSTAAGDGYFGGLSPDEAPAEEEEAVPEEPASPAPDAETGTEAPSSGDVPLSGRKIVYSGSVYVETLEYDAAVRDLNDLIAKNDCIVSASEETNRGGSDAPARSGSWTILVPAGRFFEVMDSVGTIHGEVRSRSQESEDLTRRYHDTETRIAALEVQERRLLSLMEEAASVSDLLEIEDRLTDVRYELEELRNRNSGIDLQVRYSTLRIALEEVTAYDAGGRSFGGRIAQAFSSSAAGFVDTVQDLAVLIVVLLPSLAVAAAVAAVLFATRERRARRRADRKERRRRKAEAKRKRDSGEEPPSGDE